MARTHRGRAGERMFCIACAFIPTNTSQALNHAGSKPGHSIARGIPGAAPEWEIGSYDGAGAAFDAVPIPEVSSMAPRLWAVVRNHPSYSTCECPMTIAIELLLKAGYRITKGGAA